MSSFDGEPGPVTFTWPVVTATRVAGGWDLRWETRAGGHVGWVPDGADLSAEVAAAVGGQVIATVDV